MRKIIHQLLICITASFMLLLCACSALETNLTHQPDKTADLTITTAMPVIASITKELVDGTKLKLVALPPKRYSLKRIPGWVQRQDLGSFPRSDIHIGMTSVWPAFNLYPVLRSKNINVIPIDAAHALVPGGERVAVTPSNQMLPDYFWLNLSNSLMMTGIIYRDLLEVVDQSDFAKKDKQAITQALSRNYQRINQSLRTTQTGLNELFSRSDYMQATAHSPDLEAMVTSTLLPSTSLDEAISMGMPSILITSKKAGHKSLQKLPQNIKVWHIDAFDKANDGSFTQRWKRNLRTLKRTEEGGSS